MTHLNEIMITLYCGLVSVEHSGYTFSFIINIFLVQEPMNTLNTIKEINIAKCLLVMITIFVRFSSGASLY